MTKHKGKKEMLNLMEVRSTITFDTDINKINIEAQKSLERLRKKINNL